MRSLIRSAVVLSVLAGVAAVGCSSSSGDDSAAGGGGSGGSSGATPSGGKGGSVTGTSGNGGVTSGGANSAGANNGGSTSGGTTGSGTAGADEAAGADSAAGTGGTAAAEPCNALAFSGTLLNLQHTSAALPTLANGTLQAGDYRLTSGGVYDGGTGMLELGEIAHVSIADSTATIQIADSYGHTSTVVIVMAQPSSMPPSSVKLVCDTDPAFSAAVGVEAKSVFMYGVTGNTFSTYESITKSFLVFTLQT